MAKVVAAVWGTKFIQFLAAPAILYEDEFEEQDELILFFISSWCNSSYSCNLHTSKFNSGYTVLINQSCILSTAHAPSFTNCACAMSYQLRMRQVSPTAHAPSFTNCACAQFYQLRMRASFNQRHDFCRNRMLDIMLLKLLGESWEN